MIGISNEDNLIKILKKNKLLRDMVDSWKLNQEIIEVRTLTIYQNCIPCI